MAKVIEMMNRNYYDSNKSYLAEILLETYKVSFSNGTYSKMTEIYEREIPSSKCFADGKHNDLPIIYNVNFGHAYPIGIIPIGLECELDCDNKTMVQPDVYVVCDKSKIVNGRLFGAPDFIVEVLSPSTAKKDTGIKSAKYAAAGVREYWIVDARKERIVVYILNEEGYYDISLYTVHDEIPVFIFNNKCVIDFQEIWDYLEFMDLLN